MDAETIAEIEKNARMMHAEGKYFTEWADDVEIFVTDMLDLIKASYAEGFASAVALGILALANVGKSEDASA
ncbi:hypothetical protein OV320_7808 [Actinobacteria bacterium OV320]|jgi:hypothetical protein|nr:hypothetical protein OV320_7808 [Actinobacteria bacterium OV320]